MATSQNGYEVFTSAPSGFLPWITGRIHPGDVQVIFNYLCQRFDAEVEDIRKGWSWGWNFRAIRGASSGYSNHASGTAIDLNAPAHPLGVVGTFSAKKVSAIHAILSDLDGVVRWGGDYSGRKDEMHFEINVSASRVAALANKINGGQIGGTVFKIKAEPVNLTNVRSQFKRALGTEKGTIRPTNGVARIQAALNDANHAGLFVDGVAGPSTLSAWADWERAHPSDKGWRVPDPVSLDPLAQGRFNWYWADADQKKEEEQNMAQPDHPNPDDPNFGLTHGDDVEQLIDDLKSMINLADQIAENAKDPDKSDFWREEARRLTGELNTIRTASNQWEWPDPKAK